MIPKDYYLSLGATSAEWDAKFVVASVGAGPYRFVRQEPGIEVEFAAFRDYWRKVPHVQTIVLRGVRELPVRVAALKSGEVDFAYFVTGELWQSVIDDPNLRYRPNNSAPFFLIFPARAGDTARLGFPVHPHMLWHATGFKLANEGHGTRVIQHYLGHKNIQHTVGYTVLAAVRFQGLWPD